MTDIKNWSTTAGSNSSVGGVSIAEGMAPSSVNNAMRATNAAVREWYENADWIDFGDTPTYASSTTFTISGDVTARYHANRRIRATDSSTLYGTISSSSFSSPNTTVTVTLDSGALSASLSAVAIGHSKDNDAMPRAIFAKAGANTDITSLAPSGGTLNVTGNVTASGNVTAYSAAAAKDDIVQIPNALELVERMRGVSFRWKHEDERTLGLIYEEVKEAVPELTREENGMVSVMYQNTVALLIEAVKTLKAEVDELKGARK